MHGVQLQLLAFIISLVIQSRFVPAKEMASPKHFPSESSQLNISERRTVRSEIYYTADNEATLYVNGDEEGRTRDWYYTGKDVAYLKEGDVISIKAKDNGVGFGAIVAINYKGRMYVTGTESWKATKAFTTSTSWTDASYSVCDWPEAILAATSGSAEPGKSKDFPSSTGASYVWAIDAGANDEVFLRYRIGGEKCGDAAIEEPKMRDEKLVQNGKKWYSEGHPQCLKTKISIAGDDEISIWVNGVYIGKNSNYRELQDVLACLKTGDVIAAEAIDAYNGWFGAFVEFEMDILYRTGYSDWKAVKGYGNRNFVEPRFSSCDWPKAVTVSTDNRFIGGMARPFPYAKGTRYVWAKNAGSQDTIYLRMVLGGEGCYPAPPDARR